MQQDGYAEVSTELDNYLSTLGFHLPPEVHDIASSANEPSNGDLRPVSEEASAVTSQGTMDAEPVLQLPTWLHLSQQVMGLVYNDDMPF